jgi:hypothetical protein
MLVLHLFTSGMHSRLAKMMRNMATIVARRICKAIVILAYFAMSRFSKICQKLNITETRNLFARSEVFNMDYNIHKNQKNLVAKFHGNCI